MSASTGPDATRVQSSRGSRERGVSSLTAGGRCAVVGQLAALLVCGGHFSFFVD